MKKQIKRFSIQQTSKIIALFYLILTAIFCIPLGIYALFTRERMSALEIFAMPFVYWVAIYLVTLGGMWLYNAIASYFGGIEFDLEDQD